MTDELPRSRVRIQETYDRIASHFSKTRHSPWPEVETYLGQVPPGRVGLDVGCGNGRHLPGLGTKVDRAIGVDLSRVMLLEARAKVPQADVRGLLLADAAGLPIDSDVVDVGLSIATVHHLRNREARLDHLRELGRVLAPDGRALVSAWSTTHDRFDETDGFDTTVDWTLPDGENVPRFYHIYAPEEFLADVEAAGLEVRDHYGSSGNCYAEVRP
jgi:ubiquinone/menaquinone biosynthesis C-methylase UbiE